MTIKDVNEVLEIGYSNILAAIYNGKLLATKLDNGKWDIETQDFKDYENYRNERFNRLKMRGKKNKIGGR